MELSPNGKEFIKREEGEKLTGYLDSRGIPTIGVGHTGKVGDNPVTAGMRITAGTSDKLLTQDVAWVQSTINNNVRVTLTQNQYDALCSLIFNIGARAFISSTVLRRINHSDYKEAAEAMLMWQRAGKDLTALLPRRRREYTLFMS